MGDSLDPIDVVEAEAAAVVDLDDFCKYLRRAATVLLPEDDAVPPGLDAALQDKNNQDCIRKFIQDPQVATLYIQRSSTKGNK